RRAGPGRAVRARRADRGADVDDAVVLDRHEGVADVHDQLLGAADEVVVAPAVRAVDVDLHLADRLRSEARLEEVVEQPVPVWDPSCADGHGLAHGHSIPRIRDRQTTIVRRVTQLYEPATGAPLAEVELATEA